MVSKILTSLSLPNNKSVFTVHDKNIFYFRRKNKKRHFPSPITAILYRENSIKRHDNNTKRRRNRMKGRKKKVSAFYRYGRSQSFPFSLVLRALRHSIGALNVFPQSCFFGARQSANRIARYERHTAVALLCTYVFTCLCVWMCVRVYVCVYYVLIH